jgi:hypothetical protein
MVGKFIKMCMLYITMALFLLSALAGDGRAVHAEDAVVMNLARKAIFSSSFIQYWYCENFTKDRWKQELTMLKKLGINEIIIQTTADTKGKYAAYPTNIKGFSHGDIDMLENVLTEADLLSMKVRIGLGFNDDWWTIRATDKEWLSKEASVNKEIIGEITKVYGGHPSLSGWYIPYEFCQYTAISSTQQGYLNGFLRQITHEINLKSPGKNIMISPYYNGKDSKTVPLPVWFLMVRNIMYRSGVDILALQDSVGVGYNTADQLDNIFLYTRKAVNSVGISLYSVTETFKSSVKGNVAESQDIITKQLEIEKAYVQGFVAFSINHYQNSNEKSQRKASKEYYKYYLSNADAATSRKLVKLLDALESE